jgi:hypothetical protein
MTLYYLIETSESLIRLQEFYNLPADGILNQETLALISKPRCQRQSTIIKNELKEKVKNCHNQI